MFIIICCYIRRWSSKIHSHDNGANKPGDLVAPCEATLQINVADELTVVAENVSAKQTAISLEGFQFQTMCLLTMSHVFLNIFVVLKPNQSALKQ